MKDDKGENILRQAVKDRISPESPVILISPQDQEIWENVLTGISSGQKERPVRRYYFWYASAAAVSLLIIISVLFVQYRETESPGKLLVQKEIRTTGIAATESKSSGEYTADVREPVEEVTKERYTHDEKYDFSSADLAKVYFVSAENHIKEHVLPDGSVVTLNRSSAIKIGGNYKDQRNLSLEGEAFFEVASDRNRPFSVFFGEYRLEVIGTKFNIRDLPEENFKEVTVTEGIVKVFDRTGKSIRIEKGEQLRIFNNTEHLLATVDTENYIFWKTGLLTFNDTPLEEVAVLLERQFGEKVLISPELRKRKYTGDLSGFSLEESLNIIRLTISVNVERSKGQIYVSGAGDR